jgi:hypothetical protein
MDSMPDLPTNLTLFLTQLTATYGKIDVTAIGWPLCLAHIPYTQLSKTAKQKYTKKKEGSIKLSPRGESTKRLISY